MPLTPEEQALLKPAAPAQTASSANQKKSIGELPAGSALLVTEAQNYFLAGQYDKAEADYRQILQRDPNNALALGNLATIELQENSSPTPKRTSPPPSRKLRTTPTPLRRSVF